MTTIAQLLDEATEALTPVSDSPRLDAEVLLGHALGKTRTPLYAWPEAVPAPEESARFQALLERRRRGEPIAYLTGEREFWSLSLRITPDVLIPRPETELLVERALQHLPQGRPARIADIGTGSGALAVVLGRECRRCLIVATDIAETALAVAQWNGEQLGLTNIQYRLGHGLAPLAGERFDIVLSNPPYIAEGDPHLAQGDVRFEPRHALVSGRDGLDLLRHLIAEAPPYLDPDGWLIVEHGYDQGEAVAKLMARAGYRNVAGHRDMTGQPRATEGQRP